ncbi:LamG-like jellyroll fold domain-containing protein [Micromonospora sp. GCM10011542]|uniref:LamG-like jellyroll fold domain-containing protein n=1 Tax=Micromonospora sp. GCM10011542 TaxID=3317337 RepID=UPI00361A5436
MTAGLAGLFAAYAMTAGQVQPSVAPTMAPTAGRAQLKQTEAEAAVEARASGQPVEVGVLRGESRETYANPDGTYTQVHHQQPVRVVQGGKWVPTDPTLVKRPDGSVGPRAATIGLSFSGGGDAPFASVERAGRRLSLSWPERLPAPTLAGDTATYPDVLAGVDLVVRASTTGFSHVLVVKDRQAAKNPRLRNLTLGLKTGNLTVRDKGEGRLQAVDPATGGEVFETPTPIMWDSGTPAIGARAAVADTGREASRVPPESARRAGLGVRVGGGALSLTPDAAMLDDPATVYPVYIDPFVNGTTRTGWTMVDSGYPSEEYWRFDDEPDERIGLCPSDCGRNSQVKRLMYALPTPYQDDRISIISARFKVTMVHTYDGSARNASLYLMGSGISSSTNWGNQPSWKKKLDTIAPTGTKSSCTTTNQNVEFDATDGVRDAAASNWSTTTFGIRADSESSIYYVKRFCNNATLSVTYNRAPNKPPVSALSMNPGGACVSGSSAPYVSKLPVLYATLTDPDSGDAEPLQAKFRVTWTQNGALQTKTWTSGQKNSGSLFSYNAADATSGVPTLPENVVTSWDVQAYDGTTWGPWSSDGSIKCQFLLDKSRPAGPDIDSPEYLPRDQLETSPACTDDENYYDGVGRYGTFTFDSAATDVVKYEYGFDTTPSPANTLTPATDGGPVTVTWLADSEGSHTVYVRAVDRAGKTSDTTACAFQVATGTPAVGEWGLADAPGSLAAADARGVNNAQASEVAFGQPGPGGLADRSAYLDGTGSYLATTTTGVVDTSKGFGVSLWAKLGDDSRDGVLVSQDGSGEPGFVLGFDAATKKWVFEVPAMDVNSLGGWRAVGPTAEVGKWVHLVAVYDHVKKQLALHTNTTIQPATQARQSVWKARGPVQLGRRLAKSGHTDYFTGNLADVSVFNRIVTPVEIAQLAALKPTRTAYWALDSATDIDDLPETPEATSPDHSGDVDKELTLRSGASLFTYDPSGFPPPTETALVGMGHMVLDGVNDYADASTGAGTVGNYSVTARVKLATDCNRNMAVLSQAGLHTAAYTVRCRLEGAMPRWELVLSEVDQAGSPPATLVFDDQRLATVEQGGDDGQHLALTYNDFLNEVRLYVDGQLAVAAKGSHYTTWPANGGLQIGRTRHNDAWGDHFAGVVDEVRVYDGVLDDVTVKALANPTEQPDV